MIRSTRWYQMLLLVAFSSLVLVACDDDDDPPGNGGNDEGKNYLPLAAGNWWDYDVVSTDSTTGEPMEATRHEQRATTDESVEFDGRQSSTITFVRKDNNMEQENLRSSKDVNGDIYQHLDLFPVDELDLEGFPQIDLPIGWYLVADLDANASWELERTTVPEFDFPIPGTSLNAKVGGEIIASARKGELKTYTIKGASVEAQEYIITVDPDLDVKVEIIPGSPSTLPLQGEVVVRVFLAEDIGIVEYTSDPVEFYVDVIGIGKESLVQVSGTQRVLVDYSVATE